MKIKGCAKAAREFNKWNGFARVFVNYKNGEIWTYTYSNALEHGMKSDLEVIEVVSKVKSTEKSNKTSSAELKRMAKKKIKKLETYYVIIK